MSRKLNIRRAKSRRVPRFDHDAAACIAALAERIEAVEDFVEAAIIHAAQEALSDCRHMTAH